MLLADVVSATMKNVLSAGSVMPAFAATAAAGRAMVSAVRRPSLVPVGALQQLLLLRR